MSITQEDIDALHQSPRSANDSDVTELCEKIAELQVSLAVSQREAADWKQELEAYKATENARISELQAEVTELRHAAGVSNQTIAALQADLAQARAEAKTNGDEAAAVRRLYGDAMVGIGELQAECERLRAELALKESWQESTAIYLADADRALSVLFTMLTKIGQKEGAIVADETRANVRAAMKEVAHSKSTAQPLNESSRTDVIPCPRDGVTAERDSIQPLAGDQG